MYACALRTACCAPRPGRKPKLPAENVGSNSGCKTWCSACWISRSTTVGMPSVRTPPEGLGMSTRRTGCGTYRPASNASFTLGQCTLSQSFNSDTVTASTPGAPLFRTTRWYASHMLLRSTTRSISAWSSDFVRPDVAGPSSAPEDRATGFRPVPCSPATLAGASALSVGLETIRPTLGVVVRPFGVTTYYGLC